MSKNAKTIPEPYDTYIEKISLFLKNWRIGEGLSRQDYGALADLHRNSIYNIENIDIKSFNILTLLKCINATGLSVSQFFDSLND
mgnify:CR=1 FL=1